MDFVLSNNFATISSDEAESIYGGGIHISDQGKETIKAYTCIAGYVGGFTGTFVGMGMCAGVGFITGVVDAYQNGDITFD